MRQIDDFLIDRGFQPVADWLSRWVSCHALAAFLMTGGVLGLMAGFLAMGYWVSIAMSGLWMPMRVWEAYQRAAAPPSDVLPIERISWIWLRLPLLTLQTAGVPLHVLSIRLGDYWWSAVMAGWWLFTVGLYFLACRRNPPRVARARVAGWVPV